MIYMDLQKEHISEIAGLYVEAFNSPPWNDEWTVETVTKRILQMLNCEGAYGLVGYDNGKMIGMILGNHEHFYNGMHFNIKEFCVGLNYRKQGIGSTLLNEFLERLKGRDVDEVILFTSRTDGTEGFYNKRGFKSFNSMVMMGKDLNP